MLRETLSIGDWVKSSYGPARVDRIEVCCTGDQKYGAPVESVVWPVSQQGWPIVVDMSNGHWSYADTLRKIEEPEGDDDEKKG